MEVRFSLASVREVVSQATLHIAGGDPTVTLAVAWATHEGSMLIELRPGSYVSAIRTEAGYGGVSTFVVEGSPTSVELLLPELFDLHLGIIDSATSDPVSSAIATCSRVDVARAWPQVDGATITTDEDGQAVLLGLCSGEWEIRVEKDGFETGRFETTLPGPWEPHIEAYGFVDMQQFGIAPLQPLTLQLTGTDDWDDLTRFSGNHSSVTPALGFDAEGRLELEFGAVGTPLFLYVIYPDGQQTAMNLLGQLPPDGDPVEIPVGGAASLEVALHLSQAAREAMSDSDSYLRVFFETERGDSRRVRQKVHEEGTYEFHGLEGTRATACFHVEADSGRSDWLIQEVGLTTGETAQATLNVEGPPSTVQFVDGSGDPLPELWTEIYVLPHQSTWHRGNQTDPLGMTTIPIIEEGQLAYFASQGDNKIFAVDALIPEIPPGTVTKVEIAGTEPTFVDVTLDGEPAPQAYVEVFGARSGRSFDASYTNAQGRSRSSGLTRSSKAEFRVILPGAWWDRRMDTLRPGMNRAELRSTGRLISPSEPVLERARFVESGASVKEWIEAGLVDVRSSGQGGVEADVPVGLYVLDAGQESERRVTVQVGSTAHTGS